MPWPYTPTSLQPRPAFEGDRYKTPGPDADSYTIARHRSFRQWTPQRRAATGNGPVYIACSGTNKVGVVKRAR